MSCEVSCSSLPDDMSLSFIILHCKRFCLHNDSRCVHTSGLIKQTTQMYLPSKWSYSGCWSSRYHQPRKRPRRSCIEIGRKTISNPRDACGLDNDVLATPGLLRWCECCINCIMLLLIQNWFSSAARRQNGAQIAAQVGQEKEKRLGSPDLYSTRGSNTLSYDVGWQLKFEKGQQMPRVKLNLFIFYLYSFPFE